MDVLIEVKITLTSLVGIGSKRHADLSSLEWNPTWQFTDLPLRGQTKINLSQLMFYPY